MVKAVLRNGKIVTLDPLPPQWTEGQELRVEDRNGKGCEDTPASTDRVYEELEALCAKGDSEDDRRLQAALAKAHDQAKAVMR